MGRKPPRRRRLNTAQSSENSNATVKFSATLARLHRTVGSYSQSHVHLTPNERREISALIALLAQLLGEDTVVELAADIDLRTAAPDHH